MLRSSVPLYMLEADNPVTFIPTAKINNCHIKSFCVFGSASGNVIFKRFLSSLMRLIECKQILSELINDYRS